MSDEILLTVAQNEAYEATRKLAKDIQYRLWVIRTDIPREQWLAATDPILADLLAGFLQELEKIGDSALKEQEEQP